MGDLKLVYSHSIGYSAADGRKHKIRKEIHFSVPRNTDIGRLVEQFAQEEMLMFADGAPMKTGDRSDYMRFVDYLRERGIVAVSVPSPDPVVRKRPGRRVQRLQVVRYELESAAELSQTATGATNAPETSTPNWVPGSDADFEPTEWPEF